MGNKTLRQIMAELPPERRARIEARAAELIAEQHTLQDLRRAFEKTQAELAQKLGVGQDTVSRLEQRSDMLLSTLRGYVEALGGELALIAEFPDRPPVKIKTLKWIAPELADRKRAAAAAAPRPKTRNARRRASQ